MRKSVGVRLLPMSFFFFHLIAVSLRVQRCATLSRFWCRDPRPCLLGFFMSLKVLVLVLPLIYTLVFQSRSLAN